MKTKKRPGRMRYRLVETLTWTTDDWRASMVLHARGAYIFCDSPYTRIFRVRSIQGPSLERVTVSDLKLDPCETRLGPVLEAPVPPTRGFYEALCGFLKGHLVYVCPQCGDVGKRILRGAEWAEMVKPDEIQGVMIRELDDADDADDEEGAESDEEPDDTEPDANEDDFHCPKCHLDWSSHQMLWGNTDKKADDAHDEAPTVLRYRLIELQREGEARRTWVAYETKGRIMGYKPTGFLHQVPLKQVKLENLTTADVLISTQEVVAIHPVMEAPPGTDLSDLVKAFESGRAGDPDKSSDLCNASPVGAGVAEAVLGSMLPDSGAST